MLCDIIIIGTITGARRSIVSDATVVGHVTTTTDVTAHHHQGLDHDDDDDHGSESIAALFL